MYDFQRFPDRRASAALKWQRYQDQDVLPMWVADMDFACAPEIMDAMRQRLDHPILGYTVPSEGLIEATIEHFAQQLDWKIDAQWLVWLPGVVPGLSASCRAYLEIGESAMVLTPIYFHFLHIAQDQGFGLKRVPLQADENLYYSIDFAAMEAAADAGTKVLMLCSPHNPVGRCWRQSELSQLCDFAIEHDMIIVSDEIHYGLVLDQDKKHLPTAVAAPQSVDRLVAIYSPSKTWNIAGANGAFAVIPNERLRARYQRMIYGVVGEVPTLSLTASEAAMRDGQPWLQALREQLRANYAILAQWIDAHPPLRLTPLEATYLAWIDVSAMQLENAQSYFESYGVGLSDGAAFGDDRFLRMNFACPASQLAAALSRMSQAVRAWSRHEHQDLS